VHHIQASGFSQDDAVVQLIREVAFTHLNRFCAYKMMEVRKIIRESVSRGYESNNVKFYLADHPEDEQLFNTGNQYLAYCHFLEWLGTSLSAEIGVLFSPRHPANRLLPPQQKLDEIRALLNSNDLKDIWDEDETIGWIYQYFTPKELRDKARKESQSPRNSYELAFRNQFYTPSYVVQFLTDNTLGRIWYEMRQGKTALIEQCQYMVRRPNEEFLEKGEILEDIKDENLSKDDLLQHPVHIPYRPKKDPRVIRILDPACGSGHFLLYCFTLLQTIYDEAYDDPELGEVLQGDYPDRSQFLQAIPGLILAHNLHGIDIDQRATQIAALALWLKAQKAYQDMGLKKDRPKIAKSNIVCAESMPGEKELLEEFASDLEPAILRSLVRQVFEKMKLAGEVGILLQIEEDIRDTVRNAREQWQKRPKAEQLALLPEFYQPKPEQLLLIDLPELTDEQFWQGLEARVFKALEDYAMQAVGTSRLQRQLFSDDAVQGFAFLDICRQKFDVVLMNPPFGDASKPSKATIEQKYPRTKNDVYAAFVERGLQVLNKGGMLGAITSRTGFFLSSFQKWREEILLQETQPFLIADLGHGVLDAMVETAAYCLQKQ
jgi:SAM-dependent methyltransferase